MRNKRPTPTERLHTLLGELGYTVTLWMPVKGYWKKQDVYRWECHAVTSQRNMDGRQIEVSISSWDSVKNCVRYGIKIVPTEIHGLFECWADKPFMGKVTNEEPEWEE